MDVTELLTFKPSTAAKRPAPSDDPSAVDDDDDGVEDDPNDPYEKRAAKRRKARKAEARRVEASRMAQLEAEAERKAAGKDGGDVSENDGLSDGQRATIARLLEEGGGAAAGGALDEAVLKKMVLAFEKRALKNQELRIKFPDQPDKFMDSEVDLHDALQDMRALATAPDLYPILVDLQSIPSLLGLLAHENSDVSVAVVDLLQELTDVDTLHESEDGAASLVQALADNQISALLVHNLDRLNDGVREEADGIHNSLAIIENLIEFRPEICQESADAGLLVWLVKRLKVKVPFDTNKLYASEILSILLQNEPKNRQSFGELEAIDSLLQQLAYYKRHNPNTVEEQELMENLFDCLCSILLYTPNRERFLRGEGLQLMNLMLREKKVSRSGALKVLNHALIGSDGKENCNKFIDILGLRTIFPLFMKTPQKHKRKGITAEEHEEHVISIVASLMKNCRAGQRQRLLSKFTENDHEKVERLMELHFKYLDKVQDTDYQLERERRKRGPDAIDDDEAYVRRLDGGLFSLQQVDYIIVEAAASAASTVKQRVQQILTQRNAAVKTIRNVVREYAGNLGDAATAASDADGAADAADGDKDAQAKQNEEEEQERQYLLQLVDKF